MNLQLLRIKTESVYGTDPTPGAGDFVFGENVRFTPRSSRVTPDPAMPAVGPVVGKVVGQHAEITFEVPLHASGAAGTAPKYGPLLKACGMSETIVASTSVTYALLPNPRGGDSVTISWKDDLHGHLIVGARGKVSLRAAEGQRPMLAFTFRGLHANPTAVTAPVPGDATWTGWSGGDPIAQGFTTFSFGGTAMGLRQLDVDFTDNVIFADRPHQELVDLLGPRVGTGNLTVTSPAVGTISFEALSNANTVSTASLVHGTAAGSIVTVTATAQNGMPSYSRGQDHRHVSAVPLELKASAAGASTEFVMAFT